MNDFVAELRKIPPVTRFLCGSSLAVSLPVMMNMVSAYKIVFVREFVLKQLQIWRLWSSFFLGSGGLNYIFEFVMLYRTADQLESGPYARKSADLAWQLLVASGSIILVSTPLSPFIFSRPLLVCLTYISSALAPLGAQTSLMGLITLPVQYLPYLMIGMDLLMGGPGAAAQAIAARCWALWWWGVRAGGVLEHWARAPVWMQNLLGERGNARPGSANAGAAGGVHIIPPRQPATAAAGARGRLVILGVLASG
ncbi:DER1-domain-containing protein [Infundibulicybe gibba]|nr:DER1-domain-containing protein [Infundibulicybe gibba]